MFHFFLEEGKEEEEQEEEEEEEGREEKRKETRPSLIGRRFPLSPVSTTTTCRKARELSKKKGKEKKVGLFAIRNCYLSLSLSLFLSFSSERNFWQGLCNLTFLVGRREESSDVLQMAGAVCRS